MDSYKIRQIYRLLAEVGLKDNKNQYVSEWTSGRTTHVSDLTNAEANLMIQALNDMRDQHLMGMRKKIAHLCGLYGMTHADGRLNYERINKFIKNIGSRNPKKKILWYLNRKELLAVLNQVEAMVKKEFKKATRE